MIKQIFLHVGFHKTATTSIQKTLHKNRTQLVDAGFLYPGFRIGNREITNHSEVFYSMFCPEPEKYHMNLAKNYNTTEKTGYLHKEYHQQFTRQIASFAGENIVISGEGISQLNKQGLQAFRNYLIENTQSDVNFNVIAFVRHPVDWTVSKIQEAVKGGTSLKAAIERNRKKQKPFFKLITNNFKSVFAGYQLDLYRFEDAVKHHNGITGMFLSVLGIAENQIKDINNEFLNVSLSYEATVLLSAIFEEIPLYKENRKNPELEGFRREFLFEMPGRKFSIPPDVKSNIWEKVQTDVNWLHDEMKFPKYQLITEQEDESRKWDVEVLDFMRFRLLDKLPVSIREIILNEVLKEIKRHWHTFNLKKKATMFSFLLWQYKKFYPDSLWSKYKYIIKEMGKLKTLKLLFLFVLLRLKSFAKLIFN